MPSAASIVPAVLLPPIESAMGYLQEETFPLCLLEHPAGERPLQPGRRIHRYLYISQDFDNVWGNIYTRCLENDDILCRFRDKKVYHGVCGSRSYPQGLCAAGSSRSMGAHPLYQSLAGSGQSQAEI